MLPFGTLTVFYVVLAVAIVLLLVRYTRRRRNERKATSHTPPAQQVDPVDLVKEPATSGDPQIVTTSTVPSDGSVTWAARQLFAEDGIAAHSRLDRDNPFPVVEPGDFPTADTSDYAFGPLTPTLAALLPESAERQKVIKKELQAAGYYQPHAYQNLAALRYLGIVVPLVLILLLMVLLPQSLEPAAMALLLVVPIFGWAMPRLVVRGQGRERLREIERAMPDMLDMLNMCVSQGMTVSASLRRISRELELVYPALAQELRILIEQAEVGTLEQALQNFSRRTDLPDVHSFTTLLIQTERMGTSVSAALSDYSDNMRESLRQQADEAANKATFKLLFPTVLCLMPAVFMFLLGPAIIGLGDFFGGEGGDMLNRTTQQIQRLNQER